MKYLTQKQILNYYIVQQYTEQQKHLKVLRSLTKEELVKMVIELEKCIPEYEN